MRFSIRAFMWTVLLAGLPLLEIAHAQVRKIDTEKILTERFGFSAAEIAEARSGRPVTKLLQSREATEIGVAGAVRINGTPDRLLYWLKDIASFRKAAELGISQKLSSPPQIGDFGDLSLSDDELKALEACRPGRCDLRLGDKAIARFQTEVDWAAPDAARRANLLTRQLMLQHALAYLQGGDVALGASHDEKTPRVAADEFRALLSQATNLYELAPALAAYLERFPAASLPESEQFLYWAKGGAGPEASISLHQFVVYNPTGGSVLLVDKQLYASRYTDTAILAISLGATADGAGYYALVGARARSTLLGGATARLLRGRVENVTRDTATMYLRWLQQSLQMAP
jgi:hypothetical protein